VFYPQGQSKEEVAKANLMVMPGDTKELLVDLEFPLAMARRGVAECGVKPSQWCETESSNVAYNGQVVSGKDWNGQQTGAQ